MNYKCCLLRDKCQRKVQRFFRLTSTECHSAECHSVECHSVGCHGIIQQLDSAKYDSFECCCSEWHSPSGILPGAYILSGILLKFIL